MDGGGLDMDKACAWRVRLNSRPSHRPLLGGMRQLAAARLAKSRRSARWLSFEIAILYDNLDHSEVLPASSSDLSYRNRCIIAFADKDSIRSQLFET